METLGYFLGENWLWVSGEAQDNQGHIIEAASEVIMKKIKMNRIVDRNGGMNTSYRAVAFDLGDTLVQHSKEALSKAVQAIHLHTGVWMKAVELEKAIRQAWSAYSGSDMEEDINCTGSELLELEFLLGLFRTILQEAGISAPRSELVWSLARLEQDPGSYECLPGVHRTLRAIQEKNLALILISNAFHYAEAILAKHQLAGYFDPIILSYQVGAAKPDKKIFAAALQSAGLPAGSVLFIDNNLENVKGAERAGLPAAWFNPEGQKSPGWDGSQVSSIAEVIDLLQQPGETQQSFPQDRGLGSSSTSTPARSLRFNLAACLQEAEVAGGR
jgi:putative hydrolase of the HAD superfamily